MIVLAVLPEQSTSSIVFPALRWAGVIAAYLTYRYFASRNYWVLFQNLGLPYLRMLIGAGILFEAVVLTLQIWAHYL
jgi:hypothetical protein